MCPRPPSGQQQDEDLRLVQKCLSCRVSNQQYMRPGSSVSTDAEQGSWWHRAGNRVPQQLEVLDP